MQEDTIVALSSAQGVGAIAVVRISGKGAVGMADEVFKARSGKKLSETAAKTAVFGDIVSAGRLLDEVIAIVFRAPQSYSGADTVEIYCHGSLYIQQEVLGLVIGRGARMARAGEFTMWAFANGKLNLMEAEAVMDVIESDSALSHKLAFSSLRGAYAGTIKELKDKLLEFSALIELELDFSDEDVEFANRLSLLSLLDDIESKTGELAESFRLGQAIKNGVSVAIAGKPNAGKSSLLNYFLGHDRAIVSDIAGTTRDTIEESILIEGIRFRFIDTAGIREAGDEIEKLGIERSFKAIGGADIVLYLTDSYDGDGSVFNGLKHPNKHLVHTKCDITPAPVGAFGISVKTGENIGGLKKLLINDVGLNKFNSEAVVSNARHYAALKLALKDVKAIRQGLEENLPSDLLAVDIRSALSQFSEITGEISSDDILEAIFGKFCIGK